MKDFYMIYLEGGQTPTYKHPTIESADREAKRLTEKTGKKAYVLVALKSIQVMKYEIEDLRPDDGLPF